MATLVHVCTLLLHMFQTNELGVVDSAKADDQEEKEETSEQQRRRNVVSAPARKLGRNTAQISQVKVSKLLVASN